MAAIGLDPYNSAVTTPYVPSSENLGGTSFVNDAEFPPDPDTHLSAEVVNTINWVVAAHALVTPALVISIAFNAGTPYVYELLSKNADFDSLDVSITDNGVGDTTLEWPADSFPATGVRPCGLTLNESTTAVRNSAAPVSNGVRVVTKDNGGSGVDVAWTLQIYSQ